jgi:hypothetical protein
MKTQVSILIILSLLLASFTTFADNHPTEMRVQVKANESHTLLVQAPSLQKWTAKVSLMDFNGKSWPVTLNWSEDGSSFSMDLKEVEDGEYILKVKNNKEKMVKAVAVRQNAITLFQSPIMIRDGDKTVSTFGWKGDRNRLVTHLSVRDNHKLMVSMANLKLEEANVQLNSIYGARFTRQKIEGAHSYAKLLNLEGMKSGSYFLVLRTEGIVQVQFFRYHQKEILLDDTQALELQVEDAAVAVR